jgi:hypothetical protein
MTIKKTGTSKNVTPVDYTKRGFEEIKESLKSYIKRYYPDTYQDFNKSSFGSMMLDLVAYVGDQLHYYIDHNANEANIMFAKEPENVFAGLAGLGLKPERTFSTTGHIKAYFPIPSDTFSINIDSRYLFTSHAGSTYKTQGGSVFTQTEDVVVNTNTSEIVVHRSTDGGGKPDYYMLKVDIPVQSGELRTIDIDVGDARKFMQLEIPDSGVTEILKIVDSNGNQYHEVDNLATDSVIKTIIDPTATSENLKTRSKKIPAPRRFVVNKTLDRTFIVFGNGSDADETTNSLVDPSKPVLKTAGKQHISVARHNPFNLLSSNGLGIAPENTTLTITYRNNTNENSNAAVGTISQVIDPIITFNNEQLLDLEKVEYIRENIEVFNEDAINGFVNIDSTEELKHRYLGGFSAQGRAVTEQDYISAIYSMPASYGAVKRATIIRDINDFRRNLNLYLVAEAADGSLEAPSMLLKQNVKTWIDSIRMISDSIDIFDAFIMNVGLDIKVKVAPGTNSQAVLETIKQRLFDELTTVMPDIGQPFYITEVDRILKQIPEVVHVPKRDGIIVRNLVGMGKYSSYSYDINNEIADKDEGFIYIPENTIWEIKFIDDIRGTIIQ